MCGYWLFTHCLIKAKPSPSKKIWVICLIESPLKRMKNAYFILKALSILKIFNFLAKLFGHVGEAAWLEG